MSLEGLLKRAAVPGVLAGIGLVALAPLLLRGGGSRGKPMAKALLHKYLDMAEQFKELGAEAQEQWKDLLAEVQLERQTGQTVEVTAMDEDRV